jgi:hydroxylaminobenzene mutase
MHSNAPPYRSNRLIQLGFVLFLLGLIVGFAIPALSTPRMGLASHIQGIINGIFLIVLGLVWSKFTLSARASTALFGLAVYGAFANWAATLLAAFWGAGRSMPIAAEGNVGTSMQESIIDALLLSLSLAMIGVCVLALWGLRRSATRRVRSNT